MEMLKDELLKSYRDMKTIREFEERVPADSRPGRFPLCPPLGGRGGSGGRCLHPGEAA